MAKRVTQEDIININELYLKLKTKTAVARETGFSVSTVSKYIIADYKPAAAIEKKKFTGEIPEFDEMIFMIDDWTPLLEISDAEMDEICELWGELNL